MKDNLRDAAQAALETLEDVFGKDKIDVSAINNLRAALAEPVVKDSLTVQPSDTPLTDALDAELTEREMTDEFRIAAVSYRALHLRYCALEKELAAAIDSIEEERGRAQREGERVIAAQAKIAALRNFVDKNMTFYDVDANFLVAAPKITALAQVSNRIWYHATDDTKSCPFSAVIDAAQKECGK